MEKPQKNPKNKQERSKQYLRDYARYSNLAFRLIAVILVCFFGGRQVDQWIGLEKPVFTFLFAFLGLVLSLYLVIKDLNQKNSK